MSVNAAEEERLEKKVSKWAKMLSDEEKIEHALKRLDHVDINLQLLSSTGIGKAVNALRKHYRWGERATGLVSRWKEVAKVETARAAEDAQRREESEDTTADEEEAEEEEGAMSEGEEEGEETECEGEEEQRHPLVLRIKKNSKDASRSMKPSSSLTKTPVPMSIDEAERRKGHSFVDVMEDGSEDVEGYQLEDVEGYQLEDVEEDQPIDAFASQLAAADRMPKVIAKKPKKVPGFSAESIQNSLLDSLNSPSVFVPSAAQKQQRFVSSDLNINMFKAPKEKKRVYAGKRKTTGAGDVRTVPTLFDICIRFLFNNIDAIDETGSIPFDVLRPILEKANAEQLMRLEKKNPYLREDTNYLWRNHCKREFGKELAKLREEFGSEEDEEEEEEADGGGIAWRKRYKKFLSDREQRLIRLSTQIKSHSEIAQPQRQAMVTAPIAPRYVRKRQIQNGIRVAASQVPSAVELTRARRQIFETGNDADLRSMPAAIRSANSFKREGSSNVLG
uniref:TFIIS N-terminal domain-containing protein n=1 Tax=Globodera pallida TaxID=36090 RepID=A0A183BM02_GLOPA